MAKENKLRTFTEEETREALCEIREEILLMWGRLMGLTKNEEEIKLFYRYRESFDNAILNLAKKLRISPREKLPGHEGEVGKIINYKGLDY